jgi:hypothetical protein
MKSLMILMAAALLLTGSNVSAQVDPSDNGIGIYFDLEASVNGITVLPLEEFSAHLLLTRPTAESGVVGWECRLRIEGQAEIIGWSLQGNAINPGIFPDFAVGIYPALPWAAVIWLAELQMMVLDTQPVYLFLGPVTNATVEGQMVYIAPENIGTYIPMIWSTGGPGYPVASINDGRPVAAVAASWGGVKTMYR